jgi:hypothetical protein
LELRPIFTTAEHNGKLLDLHGLFERYINLPQVRKANTTATIDFLTYLAKFDKFEHIPRWKKVRVRELSRCLTLSLSRSLGGADLLTAC